MLDPDSTILRTAIGIAVAPAAAIVLYGIARLVAMAVARWMPESYLKRRVLTDTDTGRLAYKPRPRRSRSRDGTLERQAKGPGSGRNGLDR